MSKVSSKFVPSQRFAGMQVIDNRGVVVGSVKGVFVDFQKKVLAFHVAAKNKTEMDLEWDDVLSVEDVVLLKKNVDLAVSPQATPSTSPQSPTAQTQVVCPNCGMTMSAHAKFCPKCGVAIK